MEKNGFLKTRYEVVFRQMENEKEDYSNIKPFVVIAKELANYAFWFGEDAVCCINRLQSFLYSKKMLPFVVKSIKDGNRIGELPDSDEHTFLSYAWLVYKHYEGNWYWNGENHLYRIGKEQD